MNTNKQITEIRKWLIFFIISLFLSGFTAIPLETELAILTRIVPYNSNLDIWFEKVYFAIADSNAKYPFLSYGYDWLAFAHFVLAILFIGPYKDPVRNKWVIEFGMIACLLIIPFALIAGYFRDIPMGWRLIDCSFGVIGIIPLRLCMIKINQIEKVQKAEEARTNAEYILFNQ